jgi:hypothetical protein
LPDVKVPIDSQCDRILFQPALGAPGSTPDRKARDARQYRQIATQRIVVDDNQRPAVRHLIQPCFGVLTARSTPRRARHIWVWMQHRFVGADDTALFRPGQDIVGGDMVGMKGIVVQDKDRRQQGLKIGAGPEDVGIFRGQDTVTAAESNHLAIPRLPARRAAGGQRPQVVVARSPQNFGKTAGQNLQRKLQMGDRFTDIAGQDQPVFPIFG